MQPPIVIPSLKQHGASLIFLHGLGDTGNGWAPILKMMQNALPSVKFICPHALSRPVSLNSGMVVPAWYDVYSLDEKEVRVDWDGINAAVEYVEKLAKEEAAATKKVFIGGFSQGGVVALAASVMSHNLPISGVISLSSYLPAGIKFNSDRKTPIFMGHGHQDMVIRYKWGKASAEKLKSSGYENVEFHPYPDLQHSASDRELDDVTEFIRRLLEDGTRDREL